MSKIIIYADGACRGNGQVNNVGAWAYKIIFGDKVKTEAKAIRNTTNNIMELNAVINALRALKPAAYNHSVEIYSDSQYVVMGINSWINGWIARNWNNVKNIELWQELLQLKNQFPSISFNWVRGHNNNLGNEEVDKMCNEVMNKISLGG